MNISDHYLYHIYPKKMRGDVLLPMNRLKSDHPDLFAHYVETYKDRTHVLERNIPILNCLWNDVIHTTNVCPRAFFNALKYAGRDPIPDIAWLKIPLRLATMNPCVVCSCRTTTESRKIIPDNEIAPFDLSKFRSGHLDQRTIEYYKEQVGKAQRVLLFQGVAHFLIYGEIDISECEIVSWIES